MLGVRHRIDVVVSTEPNAPILEHLRGARGALSFTVRLSANSRESRFYGMLHPTFADIVVPDKAGEPLVRQTKIWEEEISPPTPRLAEGHGHPTRGKLRRGRRQNRDFRDQPPYRALVPPDELRPGSSLNRRAMTVERSLPSGRRPETAD